MNKQRCYFVIDMKSFFASVECADRGLDAMTTKLVVADAERSDRTICLAVSPAMKELGVKNRCRLYEIPKDIEYIIAPPRMKRYISHTAKIYSIYLQYMSKEDIYQYSIDEAFLDVTDYLAIYKMRAKDFAKKLITEIMEKTGIPASCGIGTNMYLAKIALDITAKKAPDRIGWLTEDKFKKELWYHEPLTDFWGISKGISTRLARYGIHNMHGIATSDENLLYKEFGVNAELIIDHSKGIETCLMSDVKHYKSKSKSFSNSQILAKPYKPDDAKIVMNEMIQEGCYRLIKQGYITPLIHIFIGYQDEMTIGSKGTKRLERATNLPSKIMPAAMELYDSIVDQDRMVRRLGFDFSDLGDQESEQMDFFTNQEEAEKERKMVRMVLDIKEKFGKNAILRGIDYDERATQRERNEQIGGHRGGES